MSTNYEIIAAQRDELAAKVRELGRQLDNALGEIARLRSALCSATLPTLSDTQAPARGEVPSASPQKSKRARILGGGA